MAGRRRSDADDARQLSIVWPVASAASPLAVIPDTPTPLAAESQPLVLRLPWDFVTTFPDVLAEAIDAGRLQEEDATPDAVASLHAEHTREMRAVLRRLDLARDAARGGVDPETGQRPRTAASRERLRQRLDQEPGRLIHDYGVLLDVYEEAFGPKAARAFDQALRAAHAGVRVQADADDVARRHQVRASMTKTPKGGPRGR